MSVKVISFITIPVIALQITTNPELYAAPGSSAITHKYISCLETNETLAKLSLANNLY